MPDTPQDSRAMTNQQQCLNCGGSGYVKEPGHGDNCRCVPTTKCPMCKGEVALSTPQDSRGELDEIFFRELRGKTVTEAQQHILEWAEKRLKPAIQAYVDEQVAAALDLFQKDMAGYDFTPEEIRENTNALVADAVENSKAYVLKQLTPHGDKEIE